jgi:16S rRNA G966 N2-methylase RsmD
MEVVTFLNKFSENKFALTFCDPPYNYEHYEKLLEKISLMKTNLVLEHSAKFNTPEDFEKFVYLRKAIGEINFTFYDFNK